MLCLRVKNKLDEYISGDLCPEIKSEIELHLQSCKDCRHALSRLTQLAALLTNTNTPATPSGFADRIVACAKHRKNQQAVAIIYGPLSWWKTATMSMRGAVAAILMIGLLIGFVMGRSVFRVPTTGPTVQTSSESDPIAQYNLDYLSDAPTGSLAGSYLSLISNSNTEE